MKKIDVPEEFLQEPDIDDFEDIEEIEEVEIDEKEIEKEIKYYIG